MRRTRLLPVVTAVAVGAALLVSVSDGVGTDARWRESSSTTVTGPRSDVFDLTATDADSTLTVAQTWPTGVRHDNTPRIDLKNTSTRHSSWIDVVSTKVGKVNVSGDSTDLVSKIALEYLTGATECRSGTASYWYARTLGTITGGTTYTRSSAKVSGATLAPGGTKVLCPLVRPGYQTDEVAGKRQYLLNYAGRALDITTVVRQRSEAPATWSSTPRTVTSRYRVAAPSPTTPTNASVCRSGWGSSGGFFWGWPDADASSTATTPAMAGGWDILRKSEAGTWEVWKSAGADVRSLSGNSWEISDKRGEFRQFKLRGYPFAGDKTRYVESDWIASAAKEWSWSWLTDRWVCSTRESNPSAGPHNLP